MAGKTKPEPTVVEGVEVHLTYEQVQRVVADFPNDRVAEGSDEAPLFSLRMSPQALLLLMATMGMNRVSVTALHWPTPPAPVAPVPGQPAGAETGAEAAVQPVGTV